MVAIFKKDRNRGKAPIGDGIDSLDKGVGIFRRGRGDGVISEGEYEKANRKYEKQAKRVEKSEKRLDAYEAILGYDMQNDGEVNIEKIERAWREFDVGVGIGRFRIGKNDGTISGKEFKAAIWQIEKKEGVEFPQSVKDRLTRGGKVNIEEVMQAIREADKNNDGKLSYSESFSVDAKSVQAGSVKDTKNPQK